MVSPSCPWLLGSVGTFPYKFCRKGSSPQWGLWLPGHEPLPSAMSPLSFNELMQWSFWDRPSSHKQRLQDITWRLTGDLSPQFRDPAQPHSSGGHAFNTIQRAPCRQGRHTLPQARGFIGVFLLHCFTHLTQKLDIIKHKRTEVNPEWPVLLDLLWVSGSHVP